MEEKIIGFITKVDGDFCLNRIEFSEDEMKTLKKIFKNHETDGCSIRGDENLKISDILS